MRTHRWRINSLLLGLAGICTCIAGALTTTISRGNSMNPETFFIGQQLAAYRFAQEGKTELLSQATKAGLDLNLPGREDMTLLGLAVLTADPKAIVNLIDAGANPNQVIPEAGSPAILAITKHYDPPRTKAVEALLEAGYDPNQLVGEGKPYLFFFVDFNHWPGLWLALQRGGDINAHRNNGKSLLTYVIEGGDYAQARELIEMGADVTARGERGESALRAIESNIRRADPSIRKLWNEIVAMRELILSKLPDPKDRRSVFTDAAETKIRQNPLH